MARFCISKTCAAGAEYSRRGGAELQTQYLVLPPADFVRFACNPFAVLSAAEATGELQALPAEAAQGRRQLESLRLVGRPAIVDHLLLARVALSPGPRAMATLVDRVLSGGRLTVVSSHGEHLLAGLVSCLPLELRREVSFSTGLKLSLRRGLRIAVAPADSAHLRREALALAAEVLVLSQVVPTEFAADSWPALVEVALSESKFSLLSGEIARRARSTPQTTLPLEVAATMENQNDRLPQPAAVGCEASPGPAFGRSDAAHARFANSESAGAGKCFSKQRTQSYLRENPEALEMVEHLDDLVFDAIGGRPDAFTRLAEFWPEVLAQLEPDVLAEAREQYLRHGLTVWTQSDADPNGHAERAIAALDVLCLLFPETDFG